MTIKRISSRDNPFYKSLHKLSSSARQRSEAGQTLLDGAHLLLLSSLPAASPCICW